MIKENEPDNPVLAICYDFDKTLSPDDMQAQGYIQSIDYEVDDFWRESNELSEKNEMDRNLAYMYLMAEKSRGKVLFTKETLHNDGARVKLYPGVATWFDRINDYGEKKGVKVEHYIISSGLKEMIEGTEVADKFKKIYASSFYFDESGVAVWPAQVVNYTNKTQFLFRIEKGILDVNDSRVNDYFKPNEYRVPFRNMVYIGDSETDIPCMKLVNINGGHSIGVYDSKTKDKTKVFNMLEENRIKYFVPADYTKKSKLETLVKQIIDRTASNEILESFHFDCVKEKNNVHNTLDYYNLNADKFVASTLQVDFEETQKKFIEKLDKGAFILDFGCGSGRDTKYFLDNGYKVDAVDGSKELCRRASEYTGISVKNMMFTELNVKEKYDGIWACSSILHLTKDELENVMNKMTAALKLNGIIYASFKYGNFSGERNGRYFTDMTEETFEELIKKIDGITLEEQWITSDVRVGRGEEKWLNVLLRRG